MAEVASRTSTENLRIQQELDKKARQRDLIQNIIPFSGLVLLIIIFGIASGGRTLTLSNVGNLVDQCFTMAIVAAGAAFVYAHGDKDFSVGAASGVAQLVGALLILNFDLPTPIVVIAIISVNVLCSLTVAGVSKGLGVPVFVATICVRSICKGILGTVCQNEDIVLTYANYGFFNNTLVKAAALLVILVVTVYIFNFTEIGRFQKAIGGNANTVQQAGIRVRREVVISYIIMGVCVGIASTFILFRDCTVNASSGSGIEFNVMIALALGGFPMAGGEKSKIRAAIIGVVTLTVLANGLTIIGMDPNVVNGVKGLLFIAIVGLSYDKTSGKYVD